MTSHRFESTGFARNNFYCADVFFSASGSEKKSETGLLLLLLLLMLLLLLLLQLVTNRSGFKKSVSLSSGHWCDQWWWNNNGPNRSVVVAQLAEPLFLTPEIPSSSPTISNSSLRESFTLTGQKRQNMENETVMAQFKILLQANCMSTIWIEVNAVLFTSLQIV